MAFSKEARIKTFIVVDVIFFLLEITIGYTAHSLALVADAFHMLNDVISLCVGLWAVKVATNRSSSNEYTYGWARAEILGGLVNGVFLVALCLSIVLDAIQRFFEPQEVSNPKLVLIVGGVGLAFNILGLFVFHQHDHSHDGEHDHEHASADGLGAAEAGHGHSHSHSHSHGHSHSISDEANKDTVQANGKNSDAKSTRSTAIKWEVRGDSSEHAVDETTPLSADRVNSPASKRYSEPAIRRSGSRSSTRGPNINDLPIHPASFRNDIISHARYVDDDSDSDSLSAGEDDEEEERRRMGTNEAPTEVSPLLGKGIFKTLSGKQSSHKRRASQGDTTTGGNIVSHSGHKHTQPRAKSSGGGGHSHADMNIRGMFLHVLGDALGNVGVMGSALIIWLSSWPYRFYFDPIISLFITLIILKSAIPLCKETAKPLLQAVPSDLSLDDIKEDIESLPGIRSVHHLHVWALTPSKRIATLDVQMAFDYDVAKYMQIAREIKKCLREYGIHSSTIQPEFLGSGAHCQLESSEEHPDMTCCTPTESGTATPSGGAAKPAAHR